MVVVAHVEGEKAAVPSDLPEKYRAHDDTRVHIEHHPSAFGHSYECVPIEHQLWHTVCAADPSIDQWCKDKRGRIDLCSASNVWDTFCRIQTGPEWEDSEDVRGCGECVNHMAYFCSSDGDAAYAVHYNPLIPGCKQPIGTCNECLKLDHSMLDKDNCLMDIERKGKDGGSAFCYPTEKNLTSMADASCKRNCQRRGGRGGCGYSLDLRKNPWQSIESPQSAAHAVVV